MHRKLAPVVALLAIALIGADARAHPVMDALHDFDKNSIDNWQYRVVETVTMMGKATKKVGLFDPSKVKDLRWQLESLNDRAATDKEQQAYRTQKNAEKRHKLSEQIDEASLAKLDHDAKPRRWSFKYRPMASIEGFDPSKMTGIITLGATGDLASVDLSNVDSFRIKVVVKVTHVVVHSDYVRLANGSVMPHYKHAKIDMNAMGKDVVMISDTKYELIKKMSEQ